MRRLFVQFVGAPLASANGRARSLPPPASTLGIAMVIAIQLTNASSVRGFETALDTVSGHASVEIAAPWAGWTKRCCPSLGWLREFGDVSPVVEGEMALVTGEAAAVRSRRTEALKVLGCGHPARPHHARLRGRGVHGATRGATLGG